MHEFFPRDSWHLLVFSNWLGVIWSDKMSYRRFQRGVEQHLWLIPRHEKANESNIFTFDAICNFNTEAGKTIVCPWSFLERYFRLFVLRFDRCQNKSSSIKGVFEIFSTVWPDSDMPVCTQKHSHTELFVTKIIQFFSFLPMPSLIYIFCCCYSCYRSIDGASRAQSECIFEILTGRK